MFLIDWFINYYPDTTTICIKCYSYILKRKANQFLSVMEKEKLAQTTDYVNINFKKEASICRQCILISTKPDGCLNKTSSC